MQAVKRKPAIFPLSCDDYEFMTNQGWGNSIVSGRVHKKNSINEIIV